MPARKPGQPDTPPPPATAARHELVVRLRRIEGQLRAVQRMIEDGNDCEPIAQQLAAARKALDRTFFELMACAIEHPDFSSGSEDAEARVQRLTRTLAKLG